MKVLDVNGQQITKGGLALLLCEVLDVEAELVRIRVMNSEMELAVGIHNDEVLGAIADSELTSFIPDQETEPEADSLAISRFE